jgi:hypothetical protein
MNFFDKHAHVFISIGIIAWWLCSFEPDYNDYVSVAVGFIAGFIFLLPHCSSKE